MKKSHNIPLNNTVPAQQLFLLYLCSQISIDQRVQCLRGNGHIYPEEDVSDISFAPGIKSGHLMRSITLLPARKEAHYFWIQWNKIIFWPKHFQIVWILMSFTIKIAYNWCLKSGKSIFIQVILCSLPNWRSPSHYIFTRLQTICYCKLALITSYAHANCVQPLTHRITFAHGYINMAGQIFSKIFSWDYIM